MEIQFKHRDKIKAILEMNISDQEKKNLIANLKTCKTDVARVIVTNQELNIKKGDIWDNQGKATSWSDMNDENNNATFIPETTRAIEYVLKAENVEGYKVQYLSYERLFHYFYYDLDMKEDEADELADKISSDKVYNELMHLLGSDGDMASEAEILVPAETQFIIKEINDGRDDVGYIEVILEKI